MILGVSRKCRYPTSLEGRRQKKPQPRRVTTEVALLFALMAFGLVSAGCARNGETRQEPSGGKDGQAEAGILPQREDYYAADVVDDEHAWVVGSYGTILHLADGGSRMQFQDAQTRAPLFSVSFADRSNGLIGGRQGTMLRTRDGGETWEAIELPTTPENILAMARSPDGRSVWAVGPRGVILRSRDSGESWEDISLKQDVTLNGVVFFDHDHGWAVGEFGTILETTDGGDSWEERNQKITGLPKYVEPGVSDEVALRVGIPELYKEDLYIFDVAFPSREEGVAVAAGGFILETKNGGKRWKATYDVTNNSIFSLALAAPQKSMIGVGVLGTFIRREQGRWSLHDKPPEGLFTWVREVDFSQSGSFGVAVGGKATILRTKDGGATWESLRREVIETTQAAKKT